MSGHVGDLSPQQADTLKQFKVRVSDILQERHDDKELLRWLRARGFDLKKSEKMFRDSMEWRRKHKMDTIVEDYETPEVLAKFGVGGICGVDKDGFPVWIDCFGRFDIKGILQSVRKEDICRHRMYRIEKGIRLMEQISKETGKDIDQIVCITDLKDVGTKYLWKPAMEMGIQMLKDVEANYPERLKVGYAINAPKIFPIIFNMVKPFMSEHTKSKIEFFEGDWKSQLLERIDASELPVHWGGTKTGENGDEFCSDLVAIGGKIDKKYYSKNHQATLTDLTGYTAEEVGRGSSLQLEYKIDKPGSILRYNFWTENKDIAFGVYRRYADKKQKAGEMDVIRDTERVNSHLLPEEGNVLCYAAGTYVVRFDNTYSWVSSKKLYHNIDILAPDSSLEMATDEHGSIDLRL